MFGLFKKKVKTHTGKLCECTGDIKMDNMIECEYFPLKSGGHTAFMMGKCTNCDGFAGFPHYNLELAINEGSEEGIGHLKKIGFIID